MPSATDIYVRFGQWNTTKSRLIRWMTRSDWSHTWLEYHSNLWQSRMVVRADGKGLLIEPLASFYDRRGVPTKSVSYKLKDGDASIGFCESKWYLGKNYTLFSLLLSAFLIMLVRIGFKKIGILRDISRYTCSEFATLFVRRSELDIDLKPESTWPDNLEREMSNHPEMFEKVV